MNSLKVFQLNDMLSLAKDFSPQAQAVAAERENIEMVQQGWQELGPNLRYLLTTMPQKCIQMSLTICALWFVLALPLGQGHTS